MVTSVFTLLFFCLNAQGVEHFFNYSDITAPGEITQFPANFGSFRQGMSFSGALNAVSRLSYRPNLNEYQVEKTPISVEPKILSSGLGKSWGGWGFVIKNDVEKIKLLSDKVESTEELRSLQLHLGSGLKLDRHWNIGWNLAIDNDQQIKTEILSNSEASDTPIKFIDSQKESISVQVGFGFLFESESFILGTHLQTPKSKLSQTGLVKSRAWSLSQNQVIKIDTKMDSDFLSNWDLDIGLKFGSRGFTYSIADTYHFTGTHETKVGFEYIGSWGRISTGLSRHQQSNQSEVTWALGFCRSQKDFDWGVGPFYKVFKDSLVDRDEVGVIYASQINY